MNQTTQRLITILFVLFLLTAPVLFSNAQTDSASAAGSTRFKTTGGKKFWMGANYRKEWLTPVKAPVINLATEKGGLKPVRKGGGKQTKSLRLEDGSGREYVLRSIQKFITAKTLPADLQSEAAEDLVADGVSASYPYSTLSIPPLNEAASINYNKVRLVYVADDPALGEFREEFKNALYLFEERLPDGVNKDFDTDEVAEKLKDDNDNTVDQASLLRVRLLDMFVMDFDRHEGQWTWTAVDNANGKGKTYSAIPKDRDQAFYINQGLLPGMIKWPWLVPQLEGFKAKANNINRFNFAARNLDRFFLNELNQQDWEKAVNDFLPKMTDEVIERSLNQQPYSIRPVSAPGLAQILKDRRKHLANEIMEYYRFLSHTVSVTGSDKRELFEINKNNDGSVLLQVYKVTKEGEQSTKMYERIFVPKQTKELRLYSFGGDDKFVIKGGNSKIKLRMIGGEGEDAFENAASGKGGFVYDTRSGSGLKGKFSNKTSDTDTTVNSYNRLGYHYNQVIPFLSVNFNQDDGLFLGFSMKFIKHGFRKLPYKTMHQFVINHALATRAFSFRYYSEFIGVAGKTGDLLFDFDIKAPNNTTNFFGYGENSVYDKTKPGQFRYYRARYNLGDLSVLLRKRFNDRMMITLGPTYEFYKLDAADNTGRNILLTGTNGLDPNTLFAKQSYVGGKFSFVNDSRDDKVIPQKGINWITTFRYLYGLNDQSNTIAQLNSEFSFYVKLVHNRLVFANRTGAGTNFGNFEFFQAQYLGMEDNLRGYRKFRFAGKSKIYNNAELRLRVANFRTYLFPAAFGILAFYDTGKIYLDNSVSNKWLSGYGAGLWFSPLKRMVITVSYTASEEDNLPLIGLGWRF
jgi:hypothetical protein